MPDRIESSRVLIGNRDFQTAIIQLKSALQLEPNSSEARFLLGSALLQTEDSPGAIIELGKAAELKYDENKVLPLLVRALLNAGHASRVVAQYADKSLIDPKQFAELKAGIAEAYALQGKRKKAEEVVDAALKLDANNNSARVLSARIAAGAGDFNQAMFLIQGVLVDDPRRVDALLLRGEVLWLGKGDVEGSVDAYRQVLAIAPQSVPAHSALITILLARHDIDGFKKQFTALKLAQPNHPETELFAAQYALLDGDNKRAKDSIRKLLKSYPTNVRALQLAGAIELRGGSLTLAETYYKKAITIVPGLPVARRQLAEIYLRLGDPAKAVPILDPLLKRPEPTADVLAVAGTVYLQLGDIGKSVEYFTAAAKASPGDSRISATLALAQISQGRVDAGFSQLESLAATDLTSVVPDLVLISTQLHRQDLKGALKSIDRLLTKKPDGPLAHQLRGRVLVMQNDKVEARASFEKALAADPLYIPAVEALAALDIAEERVGQARRRYEAVLARAPENFKATLGLADAKQRESGDRAEITALLGKAISLAPTEPQPRLLLVGYLLAVGDAKGALAAAQDAAASIPDSLAVMDAFGRTQLANGQRQQAIATFGKLATEHPKSPLPELRLAESYVLEKKYEAATASLRKAEKLAPGSRLVKQGILRVAVAERRFDHAMQVAHGIQKAWPKESIGYFLEADVYVVQRKWEQAIASARMGLNKEGGSVGAVKLHGLYLSANRGKDAGVFASEWLQERPADVAFLKYLASLAVKDNEKATAESLYRRIVALQPDNSAALNNIAWLMIQQGKSGAIEFSDRANQLKPGDPSVMETFAAALAAEGQLSRAIEWQRKVVQKVPDAPAYRLGLAKLLITAGDKSSAKEELTKLAALGGKFSGEPEVVALLRSL